MEQSYTVYGAAGSGSVAVEAALVLARAAYTVIDRPLWGNEAIANQVRRVNPLGQIPAIVLPSGELMTESAAILIQIADTHPASSLSPALRSPLRPRFLRWMNYISAQVYSLYWARDDLSRLADGPVQEQVIEARTLQRIADCWRMMDAQVKPEGRFMLGNEISVLDLYMTVVSRWRPRRQRFYTEAPGLGAVVRNVDAEPRLAAFWADRYPASED